MSLHTMSRQDLDCWWRDEWSKGNKDKAVKILKAMTKLERRRAIWVFSNKK